MEKLIEHSSAKSHGEIYCIQILALLYRMYSRVIVKLQEIVGLNPSLGKLQSYPS